METNHRKQSQEAGGITVKDVVGLTFGGMAYGCAWLVAVGIVLEQAMGLPIVTPGSGSPSFTEYALFSMLVGIGFAVPTLVYRSERIARGLKALIHLGIGFSIYLPVALHLGWIPTGGDVRPVTTVLAVSIILVGSLATWLGFYLYYRAESKRINQKLASIREEE
ncbi:MAG: DUF3021 domain-containing protein [Clostridiales Family XIII bacterium]|jgi:hypothetical protein|nr:DUF3021 domain-containing protein [Clostridiales Family XIII bacterium]